MHWTFRSHHGGDKIIVEARDEAEARRLAMIAKWGPARDNVVPYAPNYVGTGLSLIEFSKS
jgi:hypothetical protein